LDRGRQLRRDNGVTDMDEQIGIEAKDRRRLRRSDLGGYPYGLSGDEIWHGALVIAVADVLEAMASHRPYRPARGTDAAMKEIVSQRGTLFDAA
jgi:hypothetical protein